MVTGYNTDSNDTQQRNNFLLEKIAEIGIESLPGINCSQVQSIKQKDGKQILTFAAIKDQKLIENRIEDGAAEPNVATQSSNGQSNQHTSLHGQVLITIRTNHGYVIKNIENDNPCILIIPPKETHENKTINDLDVPIKISIEFPEGLISTSKTSKDSVTKKNVLQFHINEKLCENPAAEVIDDENNIITNEEETSCLESIEESISIQFNVTLTIETLFGFINEINDNKEQNAMKIIVYQSNCECLNNKNNENKTEGPKTDNEKHTKDVNINGDHNRVYILACCTNAGSTFFSTIMSFIQTIIPCSKKL